MTPEEAEVFAPVQTLFDGIAQHDTGLMRSVMLPGGHATIIRGGKILQLTFEQLLERMPHGAATLEETMDDPLIRIDQDIAMVWGAYDFLKDGELDHHGTNLVHLIRVDGRWLIANVADNSRPPGTP
jgi:hypothetical protein